MRKSERRLSMNRTSTRRFLGVRGHVRALFRRDTSRRGKRRHVAALQDAVAAIGSWSQGMRKIERRLSMNRGTLPGRAGRSPRHRMSGPVRALWRCSASRATHHVRGGQGTARPTRFRGSMREFFGEFSPRLAERGRSGSRMRGSASFQLFGKSDVFRGGAENCARGGRAPHSNCGKTAPAATRWMRPQFQSNPLSPLRSVAIELEDDRQLAGPVGGRLPAVGQGDDQGIAVLAPRQ